MKRLLIISDINGFSFFEENHNQEAIKAVVSRFDQVVIFNTLQLAEISINDPKQTRHQILVEAGIDVASSKLAATFKHEAFSTAIGFSVGGVILWEAIKRGLNVCSLLCFSSTRLRYEKQALPNIHLSLYFGELDMFKPNDDWFSTVGIGEKCIKGHDHEFYKEDLMFEILLDEFKEIRSDSWIH